RRRDVLPGPRLGAVGEGRRRRRTRDGAVAADAAAPADDEEDEEQRAEHDRDGEEDLAQERHQSALPSASTSAPPATVRAPACQTCSTRPGRSRPRDGELTERPRRSLVANSRRALGSTSARWAGSPMPKAVP